MIQGALIQLSYRFRKHLANTSLLLWDYFTGLPLKEILSFLDSRFPPRGAFCGRTSLLKLAGPRGAEWGLKLATRGQQITPDSSKPENVFRGPLTWLRRSKTRQSIFRCLLGASQKLKEEYSLPLIRGEVSVTLSRETESHIVCPRSSLLIYGDKAQKL